MAEKSGHNNGGVGAGLGSGVSAIATKVTSMTESSSIMTSSLPNMELSNDDLDKLSDRLGKFKSPSRLPKPKPEIQPKPAHLVAQLAKHKVPVPVASPTSPTTLEKDKKSTSPSSSPNNVTASAMLKSTLKRMTKLTTSPVSRSSSFKEPPDMTKHRNGTGSLKQPLMARSNSLRKVKNKDKAVAEMTNGSSYSLSRSGTSGTLDRNFGSANGGVKRTPSMTTVRRFRDKDLNVKLSRGVQTQLTKDTVDEPDFSEDGGIPTNLDFTVYLPDLFGGDNDQVETHVSEPTEPIDVRKNRQLTLDNMKLHRELEKLKQTANEHDLVKKELRSIRTKYEDEQKARHRLEQAMDMQNKKVKQIVESMNGVEREFEKRDATIYDLEGQVKVEKSKFDSLEAELQKASRIIESQKGELGAARKMQKTLVEQCEHVEGESRELQEFLQIEKMALSETLKDAENEIETLKETITAKENEVKEAEERCGHLVRLGERRHQELLTSTQQLKAFSDMAKSMLISQGTELYQVSSRMSALTSRLSAQLSPGLPVQSLKEKSPLKDAETVKTEIESLFNQLQGDQQNGGQQKSDDITNSLQTLSVAIEKRRRSESILPFNGSHHSEKNGQNGDTNGVSDNFDKLEKLLENLINQRHMHESSDQNDPNQLNTDESMNKENSSNQNGTMISHETAEEMRAKFMKHQQIYKANYEHAETEIKRMDELYQDLIVNVLKTLVSVPETLNSQPELQRLKEMLEKEANEPSLSMVTSPDGAMNGGGCKNGKVNLDPLNNTQDQENLSL